MRSKPEGDLARQYRQLLLDFPRQQATLSRGQYWSWIDSGRGEDSRGEKMLVLLPGFMGEAETSFLYIQALAGQMRAHLRTVSISYPPSVGRVDHFCDGLCALLDHLSIQQATILGGSSSGFLAQAFIRHAPARTGGLILTHTGLPSQSRARTAQRYLRLLRALPFELVRGLMLLSVFSFFPHLTPSHAFWRAHFRFVIRCQSREALLNRFELMHDFHQKYRFQPGDLAVEAGRILLMEMQRDHLTSPAEQAEMRALYPGARLHRFADTAHFDSVEKPDEQIRVIVDFMTSSRSEDGPVSFHTSRTDGRALP